MVGALLPDLPTDDATLAARLESWGYDSLWTGELWGDDAFVRLATAAAGAERAALGTAIVNVFSRTPATLATGAATLARRAPGRVHLGLGTSTEQAVGSLHGMEFHRPVRRLHETGEAVRRLTGDAEGTVDYEGELVAASGVPPLDADVSVSLAALGPAARRATGRVGDGWLPHNVPFPDLGEAFETVARTARESGRDPDDIAVRPYVPAAVADDPDEARDLVRAHVAYYVGSGEGYRRAVGDRFPDRAERIAEAWHAGEREAATDAVTDGMVDALGVAGDPERAAERFREVAARDVIDEPLVKIPAPADDATAERTLELLGDAV
ncbi:MAG: LLM class flavin-dependent oxidoreductase [Haloferacaceae archaeon]